MKSFESKALEITTQIVVAKMGNSGNIACKQTGKDTAEFFKEVYNAVKEITSSIEE